LFKLAVFLKPYKKECILGPLFKLFEAILELLLPTIMALIINNGVIKGDLNYTFKFGALMLIMSILGFCSSMVCQYYAARTSQGFGTILRNTMFKHISTLSYTDIDKFGTSSLTNRLTNDVNQLQVAVAMLIRLVVRAPFICIGAIVMAMILDFKLSLILLGAAPIFALILYFIITKTSPLYKIYQQKLDKLGAILKENLSGVRVIRAFAKADTEKQRFKEATDDLTSTAINVGKISALLNPMTTFVVNAAIIAILWVGGYHINAGNLSQGEIIAFVNYITQMLLALIVVSNLVILYTKSFASANRVNEVLNTVPSIMDNVELLASTKKEKSPIIEFKNVSFAYSNTGDLALEDASVTIHAGETIGLIGSTGSGKSTFVNLIPRFYDVTKGEILIDGIDIKNYPLKELRQKISTVPQKAVLFTGTVAENIRWGNNTASSEEITAAAKLAQAHEFIEKLPEKYEHILSRGGQNLSGGQKQRLTIARAVVSKPEILILDDSSSALDYSTDALLRSSIRQNLQDTTVLIVSQRASSIREADKILVFDDGKIVAIGTHDDLMKTCEVYKEICLSQLSSEEALR
jgi:ATP-binding cassette subfamily B protein